MGLVHMETQGAASITAKWLPVGRTRLPGAGMPCLALGKPAPECLGTSCKAGVGAGAGC